jgi:hypothetical protein
MREQITVGAITVDLESVAQLLKELKQSNNIDGYWIIKDAIQHKCKLTQAQADSLFGQPSDTGEIA